MYIEPKETKEIEWCDLKEISKVFLTTVLGSRCKGRHGREHVRKEVLRENVYFNCGYTIFVTPLVYKRTFIKKLYLIL